MRDDTKNDWKYLPVKTLRDLLAQLPDDARIGPNSVMNLAVMGADGVQEIAFIDFAREGKIDFYA